MPLGTHKIEITAHNIDPDIDPKQFTAIGATAWGEKSQANRTTVA